MPPAPSILHPARWWSGLPDGRVECRLCPRFCKLADGQRGFCFVRQRAGDGIVLTTYGRSSGFCIDPIEKKPLNHFHPGSAVLSFGTAGCNLGCRFCQNWDISKARESDRLRATAGPETIAAAAVRARCRSVAFTYNDPVDFRRVCHRHRDRLPPGRRQDGRGDRGLHHPEARGEFFRHIDAANVDLKAFSDGFYQRLCHARLAPVLDTLQYIKHETDVWLEITTLLIPGENDCSDEFAARPSGWRRTSGATCRGTSPPFTRTTS